MRILVTGGAGFIGSHLTEALLALGHEVHVLDNLYSGFRHNVPPAAVFHEHDINSEAAANLIAGECYEAIFHQAAQMDVRKSVQSPSFDAHVNILGSLNLLEAAQRSGTRLFVFASSGGAAYGEQSEFPAPETHPLNPASPYGISKMVFEHYLRFFHETYGLHYVALRYGNVYGPRQSPHGEAGVIAIFAERMLKGQQPVINGDGLQTRDFVYVEDVVAANLAALHLPVPGAYNVGTGVETDIVAVFDALNKQLNGAFVRQHAPHKAGEQRRSVICPAKLGKAAGWQIRTDFQDGIAKTFDWFAETARAAHNPA